MATNLGPKLIEAILGINDKLFKNVILHNEKVKQMNSAQTT